MISFKENKVGGLISQGIGTSMLQMGNIIKNPKIWIAPIVTSAITGPIATCVFKLQMNGTPVSSGMGTCGLVGQIGVYTGWMNDIAYLLLVLFLEYFNMYVLELLKSFFSNERRTS